LPPLLQGPPPVAVDPSHSRRNPSSSLSLSLIRVVLFIFPFCPVFLFNYLCVYLFVCWLVYSLVIWVCFVIWIPRFIYPYLHPFSLFSTKKKLVSSKFLSFWPIHYWAHI
jgi:hypothetical protein